MAKQVASVEKRGGNFFIRFTDGSCTSVSAGIDAELVIYTNETITYKSGGRTYYYNFVTNSKTSY